MPCPVLVGCLWYLRIVVHGGPGEALAAPAAYFTTSSVFEFHGSILPNISGANHD